jgi:effector-binding domain-containing protein
VAGPPFARYLSVGPVFEVEAGFPFVGTIDPSDPVAISALPGGAALTCRYVGDYDGLGGAWHELDAWREKAGMAAAGPCWESYLTDPREPGPPVTLLVEPLV